MLFVALMVSFIGDSGSSSSSSSSASESFSDSE